MGFLFRLVGALVGGPLVLHFVHLVNVVPGHALRSHCLSYGVAGALCSSVQLPSGDGPCSIVSSFRLPCCRQGVAPSHQPHQTMVSRGDRRGHWTTTLMCTPTSDHATVVSISVLGAPDNRYSSQFWPLHPPLPISPLSLPLPPPPPSHDPHDPASPSDPLGEIGKRLLIFWYHIRPCLSRLHRRLLLGRAVRLPVGVHTHKRVEP